jgi:hypothetical protein
VGHDFKQKPQNVLQALTFLWLLYLFQDKESNKSTHYIGNIVYEGSNLSYIITDEGRAVPFGTGPDRKFVYEYNLKTTWATPALPSEAPTLPGQWMWYKPRAITPLGWL